MGNLPETTALDLEMDDGWLTVWFNDPESRNPLTAERIGDLKTVCQSLRGDRSIRGVTLRGRGKMFCAGGDLKSFRSVFQGKGDRDEIVQMSLDAASVFDAVNTLPQLTVMAVEGAAAGGGLGLACVGDIVIADEEARFSLPETTIGLIPAQIAPFVLDRMGHREGRKLMMLASALEADAALKAGLVDQVTNGPDEMDAALNAIRSQFKRCAPGAVAATKQLIHDLPGLAREDQARIAAEGFADRMLSDEAREGIASFLEKRKPKWAGD